MGIAFALEGFGIMALALFGRDPVSFVILSGLVFFAWGEIYSLFPAICCDIFGTRYATANAGLLYTAKGTAALLVPFSSLLAENGSWTSVFSAAAGLNLLASAMALLMLKPMRHNMRQNMNSQQERGNP
jgi:OFA family oxalate/formate antiporter-like MFS transporter